MTMHLNPYLNFNGDCAAAFRFYEQSFGGTLMMQTHGDTPMKDHVPADWQDRIIHARLTFGDNVLMGSDSPPENYAPPQGMYVSIQVAARGEGARLFDVLAQGGRVTMPFEETFWSPGFGMLVDRFGTPWMVNCQPAA